MRVNKHRTDIGFGSNLLVICAIASEYSDDARIFLEDSTCGSAGWRWFDQVAGFSCNFMGRTTLHDVQFLCVSILLESESSHLIDGYRP